LTESGGADVKVIAVLLIVLGLVALAYGGITMTTRDKIVDLGPVEVTQEEQHRLPLTPIVGGVAVAAGIIMLVAGARKSPVR
jgi:UDP-N-acetylmuramyl pentapeptide phosphotransferase/UDP-N-acetylglucosamine-1-phosphate transferase